MLHSGGGGFTMLSCGIHVLFVVMCCCCCFVYVVFFVALEAPRVRLIYTYIYIYMCINLIRKCPEGPKGVILGRSGTAP